MSEIQSNTGLHFLCGKIASGKSTLAQQLVRETQAVLLSEDTWLATLYPGKIDFSYPSEEEGLVISRR